MDLRIDSDTFGHQLREAYQQGYGVQIIERDDGMLDVGDAMHYFSGYESWYPQLQTVLDDVEGKILDVGCGAGRHSLYLQQRGLDVFATDVSPRALRICEERGIKQTEVCSIAELNNLGSEFDVVLLLGNNLGLLGDIETGRGILKMIHAVTSKGGVVIGDTRDPHQTEREEDGQYHQNNRENGRLPGHITLRSRHRKLAGPWFDYFFYTRDELEEMANGSGWKVREFIDYDRSGSKYIAVFSK